MNNKKFDLNKFLQSPKLFTPIDYFGITVPSVSGTQEVVQNFEDWRKSQGYKTEEEKQEDLKAEMQAAQQRFNDQDLWNSEDPYEVYNTYQTDPEKQEEFKRNGEMVAGIGSTIATLPFTAGMMGGWTPAIVSTATGVAGGHAGAYGGQKLGQYIDNKYGTNLTPGLTFAGGLIGGTITGGLGYKGWEGATNQYLINKAFKSGQLKWGQPTSYTAYHQSATPITKFKFPFKRWDVAKHGADPNGAFFTVGKPAGSGFLAERPYTGQFQVKVQKPLIQTGELTGPTKNGLRNAIVRRARKNGADAVFFDGIADNTLQNQQILFAMDNADISFTGGPGKVRYFGPTMGKTTLVKTNNNYVDLDQLVKPLRKQVAERLGLKVSDPRVAKSPEYQTALKQIVEEFQTNTANAGKTLVGSQKQLLNGDFVLDGEPMLPDFETFVTRNQARGFGETPEQLRVWYDEILGLKPDIKVDNRYVSEIVYGKPSKLTLAERMGIPKGERNQPLNGHLKGDDAVQMFKDYGTQFPEDMVRLYRASGTSGNFKPSLDGTAKYSGMWFTDNPRKVNRYASSTFKTAKQNGVDNPIVLEYIDIPKSQLDRFRAKNIIKGNDVEFELTEDFLIPVDHAGRKQVSWTGFTGNYLSDMRIPHPELPPISKNSKIYSQIQQLVPEARERYKLVGRTDITDDEIAGSLYKRAMELNGNSNAAIWETGEPRLLFRGDTRRYNRLMDKLSPEKLAKGKGTMDNSLGNLFLGDISGKGQGVDRYFISGNDFFNPNMQGSATGARGKFGTIFANGGEGIQGTDIPYIPKDAYKLATYQTYAGPYSVYKFPGKYSESGISDLNTFITRTPAMRDATGEISVLADDIVMKTKNYRGPNIDHYDGPTYDGVNSTVRDAMAKHYQSVLDDAQSKGQGLLFSEGLTDKYVKKFRGIHPFRREHEWYDYYALPNFNRQNAKHLFGWDLRRPVQWDVDNIYLEKGGKIENPDH